MHDKHLLIADEHYKQGDWQDKHEPLTEVVRFGHKDTQVLL